MTAFDDAWRTFEEDAGPLLAEALSVNAPSVTGTLAGSMGWEDQSGRLTAGSRDPRGPIARFVTRGTQPHDIYPVVANALHFFASDGTEVFTQHVHHPGTTANPFHIAAWESVRDECVMMFRDTMPPSMSIAYLNPWRQASRLGIRL